LGVDLMFPHLFGGSFCVARAGLAHPGTSPPPHTHTHTTPGHTAGPARFAVDLDGGLDEVDTGPAYAGPPMHTISVFVNPPLPSPDPTSPTVTEVKPGRPIPAAVCGTST